MTTARDIVRREDSSVKRSNTRAEGVKMKRKREKQASSDQSPHDKEQSRSMDGILWKQGRKHGKEIRL